MNVDCSKTNKHVSLREGNHSTSNSYFTIRKLRERLCNTRQTHGLWSRVHNMTTVIIFKEKIIVYFPQNMLLTLKDEI